MPLAAAAFAPSTPLLVPEIAGGAAAELHDVRTACDTAVSGLWAADPDLVAVVAVGGRTGEVPPPYRGSFAAWGVPIDVTLSVDEPNQDHDELPLAALLGLWLLARHERARDELARHGRARDELTRHERARDELTRHGRARDELARHGRARDELTRHERARDELARREPVGAVRLWTVDPAAEPADCAALGRAITADSRVALLVLGDGAARHAADPRAESFDAAVLEALVDVDTARLLELDPELAGTLLATGRAPLQVLAGATGGQKLRSNVRYAAKPYGVGYFVASWQ